MVHLFFEYDSLPSQQATQDIEFKPTEPAFNEIATVRAGWQRHVVPPYVRYIAASANKYPRKVSFSWSHIEGEEHQKFELILDAIFFDQVLQLYATYGWAVLKKLMGEAKKQADPVCFFISETVRNIAVLISQELQRLELHLVTFAGIEWTNSLKNMERYKSYFQLANKDTYKFTKPYEEMGQKIYKLCVDYARNLEQFEGLKSRMEERNRKDRIDPKEELRNKIEGKPERKRTYAQAVWFELYASQQREVMKELSRITQELSRLFPPAILVLEDLPSEVKNAEKYKSYALDNVIRVQIGKIINQLELMQQSLKNNLQTDKLKPFIEGRAMPDEGPEGFIQCQAEKAENGQNRIMADLGLVQRWLTTVQEKRPVSWEHAVVRQYYLFLKEQELAKQKEEQEGTFWKWTNVALAILSIVVFVAVAATGGLAAPAGLALALSIANYGVFVLTIAVMIHGFIVLREEKEDAQRQLEEEMYKLGQMDPNALAEVGYAIQNSASLQGALTKEILTILFEQAVAKKFKAIAWALDVQGFFSDMDTLFSAPILINE